MHFEVPSPAFLVVQLVLTIRAIPADVYRPVVALGGCEIRRIDAVLRDGVSASV